MPAEHAGPVVLLGVDALDPDLVEQWVSEGKLPAFAKLIKRGSWARTTGPELLCEHGIWVSIFGGVSWSQHGFHFFWQPVPNSYDLQLVRGADARVAPFWAQLSGSGLRAFVLDPPDTAPVPGVAGMQVSEWATHSHYPPLELASDPPSAVRDVELRFGPREKIGETIGSSAEEDAGTLERLVDRAGRKGEAVRKLIEAQPYELIVAVFAEAHTGGHQLWEYRRGAKGDGVRDDAGMGDGVFRLYRAVDRAVGEVIDALPESAQVFVVSSVGMLDHYPVEELIENFCRTLGYQATPAPAAEGSARRPASPIAWLRSLVPESVRNTISRYLPLDVQAKLLSQKFVAATDWSRTRAYAMPGYYTGSVRVNLRGREPAGIVAPGDEYDTLLDQLDADFRALTDADTGVPLVDRTERPRSIFGPDLHPSIPDLLVFWRAHNRPILRAKHPRADLRQSPHVFHRGSHHTVEGFLIAAGPGIRAGGNLGGVSPLAIAPTLLTLLGVPVPPHMRSAPLTQWLTP